MENNEIVRSLKFYCDAIFKYDYEKDKVFFYYDSMHPEHANKWFGAEQIIEVYTSNCVFAADVNQVSSNLSRDSMRRFCEGEECCRAFELKMKTSTGETAWHEVILQRQGLRNVLVSCRNIFTEVLNSSLKRVMDNILEDLLFIDTESGRYMNHIHGIDLRPVNDDGDYDRRVDVFIRDCIADSEAEDVARRLRLSYVLGRLAETDQYTLCVALHGDGGAISYKKLTYSYIGEDHTILVLARFDVSDIVNEYKQQLKYYEKESYIDGLTGAYNRKHYEERLKNSRCCGAVAIFDLDDFKLCNDIYGHAAGDAVLSCVSGAVRACLHDGEKIIRYGGDEFMLLLPTVLDRALLTSRLDQLCDEVAQLRLEEYPGIELSISMGGTIAVNEPLEEALARADRYMYIAKTRKGTAVTSDVEGERGSLSESEHQRQQVLIVDDSELNRDMLSEMLGSAYSILTAGGGEECLEMLHEYGTGISLILLDIIMPGISGFDVLEEMNRSDVIADIPVIMISSENSDDVMNRAYGLGISDYISRPFDMRVVCRRVYNIIKMNMKQRRLTGLLSKQMKDRERSGRLMVDILSHIVELRNGENGQHAENVARITELLLARLATRTDRYGLTYGDRKLITLASSLHDIGKIGISEEILGKHGELTPDERRIMQTHTVLGEQILNSLERFRGEKLVRIAAQVCRHHHERYDGSGYPDGLVDEQIPISAQVVSLADAYDALVSERPYKAKLSHADAMRRICFGECGAFNPLLLECLRDIEGSLRDEMN